VAVALTPVIVIADRQAGRQTVGRVGTCDMSSNVIILHSIKESELG
jgi:hypothetical protein